MRSDPLAGRQRADELAVETAGMPIVDVVDGGGQTELGIFETAGERLILTPCPLLIDQQGETFLETEPARFGIFGLAPDSLGHTGKFHGVQFLDSGLH